MNAALGGLSINGKLVVLGAAMDPLEVPGLLLISGRRSIMGWPSGSSTDSQDTMAFSALAGVRPMTEVFPLEQAAEAYERMMSNKARFRVVLTPKHYHVRASSQPSATWLCSQASRLPRHSSTS